MKNNYKWGTEYITIDNKIYIVGEYVHALIGK